MDQQRRGKNGSGEGIPAAILSRATPLMQIFNKLLVTYC
jgi:hypothetical protein